ncbi:hypothetical protein [Nocardia sp. XZ_19_231]|uniref:hypothetical protein n=1 Tax=Nocardia sp. XZ_19_231 TaxID=2769252 RepID=UPI00188EBF79|nr:hypothetical protein [Nocardia sp. XZ_19_231]
MSRRAIFITGTAAGIGRVMAAVRSLTEALDLEWRSHGIAVHDIMPLYVSTSMIDDAPVAESVRTPGVHRTADDVADQLWRKVIRPRTGFPHVLVGTRTKVAHAVQKLAPAG